MLVPKQNQVLYFSLFSDFLMKIKTIHPPNNLQASHVNQSGAILYGVELLLISISRNNYGMLEIMIHLSTAYNYSVLTIPAVATY